MTTDTRVGSDRDLLDMALRYLAHKGELATFFEWLKNRP